ncbi:hypothetical protein GQ42DRAFT_143503 [Ramicandelaber brevisporus]|nr:hypothetical protein GQ42DRAFT_143503 [Ramicandelaber brevisporus]
MSSERFLPTVLLRPAFMYGPGDFTTFNSMLVMAEISRRQGKPTMVYYGDEIRLDMIHVRDVARSILHAAIWHARPITTAQRIEIFNVTPMEHRLVSELTTMAMHTVGVKTKRMPYLHRLLFKNVPADVIAKKVNEQYLPIWDEMVRTSGARPSPVGPRLDPVQLKNGHHCSFLLNGSKLLHGTGFVPMYPICSEFTWMEVIDEWRSMDIWPKELSVTC